MPLLVARLGGLAAAPSIGPEKVRTAFPNGVESEFRTLFFECAQTYSQANILALSSFVPSTQIMFGTDYNRFPIDHAVQQFENLKLDAAMSKAIARENAVTLFPRLK